MPTASEEPKKRKQKGNGKGDADTSGGKGKRRKNGENTKEVKPAEKKAPRKKRGTDEPTAEMEAPLDGGSSGTKPEPQPKKASTKRQKQASEPEPPAEIQSTNPKSDDGSGIRVVDDVMTKLEAFRGDETKWSSLTALYQAMVGEQPSRQNDLVPKYSHYNLSMYWTKGRVGLLDKEKNHILSFSSASTQRIGLPLRATMLYVSCSPCLEHLWFSFGFGGVVWVPISVFNLWLDVN